MLSRIILAGVFGGLVFGCSTKKIYTAEEIRQREERAENFRQSFIREEAAKRAAQKAQKQAEFAKIAELENEAEAQRQATKKQGLLDGAFNKIASDINSGNYQVIDQRPAQQMQLVKEFNEVNFNINNCDDTCLIYIKNGNSQPIFIDKFEWFFGRAGKGKGSLTEYMKGGQNYILFFNYNKKGLSYSNNDFSIPEVLTNWSYNFYVYSGNDVIFQRSQKGKGGTNSLSGMVCLDIIKSNNIFSYTVNKTNLPCQAMFDNINKALELSPPDGTGELKRIIEQFI